MKKILLALTLVMSVIFSSVAVFAEGSIWDYQEFVIKENPNNVNSSSKSLNASAVAEKGVTKTEIDTEFANSAKKFNSDKNNFTDDKRKKALKKAEDLQNNVISKSSVQSMASVAVTAAASSSYDQNKAKLRVANFIEGILDTDEGMSLTEIYAVGVTHANKARDKALQEFPNTNYTQTMLCDSFRHFSWNNMSTKDIGAIKTRTATINHEWGIKLLEPMTNYYNSQYNDYVSKGVSDAANKAFADTVMYITTAKYYMVSLCKGSYKFFKGFFDVANIMDLHNNCWGRAYAGNYPSLSYRDAYYKAKGNNELILAENKVTDANYDYIWRSQWYTY